MPQQKTLALLDASGYLYRAFHAIRPLTAPDGRPTNATFGFATMLRKLLSQRRPDAVAVCFDRPEKTFRHEMDPEYKATRSSMPDDLVPQVADVKALCRAMGLAVVEEPGFEADDLIGTLAEKGARAGLKVEVVSADKDLFQLVRGDEVAVWHPVHEKLLDEAGVAGLFGAPPARVIDVLGLMGDASDNIPGVKGIGEKGAKELVATFGGLEEIYARIGELKGKRREALEAGKDDAFRSRELATVRRDAPVPGGESGESLLAAFGLPPQDRGRLAAFYEELGFFRLKKELLEAAGPAPAAAAADAARGSSSGEAKTLEAAPGPATPIGEKSDLPVWETSSDALGAFLALAAGAGLAGLHVESAPGRPFPPEPIAVVAAVPGKGLVAAPLAGDGAAAGRAFLAGLFSHGGIEVVAHESKRLHLAAATLGIAPPGRVFDTMLAAYVDGPGLHAHDLAGDARALLGRDPATVPSPKDVAGSDAFETSAELATDAGLAYLAPRALLPLALGEALRPRLAARPASLGVYEEIELPLVPVLARMERTGIAVDPATLAALSVDLGARLASLEKEIHGAAGEAFNVGSPPQLGRILFEKLQYPVLKKTAKTKSYATGSEVLEELAVRGVGPLPGLVLEWRELSKLKGTYVDALPRHLAKDGRIHTRFDQAVAATGRLSSNDPNLQNIPVRTAAGRAIRKAFVAPPGRLLVAADYSQVELRLLAHLSGDAALIEAFRRGEDIHRATAAKIFGIDPGLVSPDQRRGAKTINFGILYGMGPFALAGQLGVPQGAAKSFIASYFERFPSIRACLDGILARARETGATETILGRLRPIPGIVDRNHAVRANAERMAMNAPFQGAAADLIKKAMVVLDRRLSSAYPSARMLLQVHDELVLECDAADAPGVSALAKETMEGVAALAVPLTVDTASGADWAAAK
ncbi:MAG: DNA polymerase I [Holophagales bacterium]|nr:DNA polymerase I [Holophagales bacterium]